MTSRIGVLLAALVALPPAQAHVEAAAAIPEVEGARLAVSAALVSRSASQRLPSQGLPGYLLLGDPGVDERGSALEHAVLQGGYRFTPRWGAELALGVHGTDPVHVESAWVQGRGDVWTLGAGRHGPSLGPVLARAGHLDRFGLMPLAKQAVLNGDWIDDGAELGLNRQADELGWRLDAGVWAGRRFPGVSGSPAFPSLHGGLTRHTALGDVSADAFVATLRPAGRGSRIATAPGGHTHTAPVCDAALREVVCFDGRSRVAGLSAHWASRDWPLTLAGALLWRDEDGSLQSRNGLAQYTGRTRGDWQEGLWQLTPDWQLGLRHERLSAQQTLQGPGATLVAAEAGLGAYAPQRRLTALLGWSATPWADLRLEWGRESTASFVAVRLVVQWDRGFGPIPPSPFNQVPP